MLDAPFRGPEAYALADWRRRINDLYAEIRAAEDPQAAWQRWCTVRAALFAGHPLSPLPKDRRAAHKSIDVFPYDRKLRFAVDLARADGSTIDFDLGPEGSMAATPLAVTRGLSDALGAELTAFWIGGYGGGLFIPFRDATTGSESYGGGRYVVDAIKGADLGLDGNGRLILDFNFAYNPSCALNDAYVCPLSPPSNTLPAAVRAGERTLA